MNNDAATDAKKNLRVAVIAHALRAGGGLSAGRNTIAALAAAAPEHHYLFIMPAGREYESLNLENAGHETVYYTQKGGYAGRWAYDAFALPRLIREFRPDVVLGLANRGLAHPPCPQAILCRDSHFCYPMRHYARETLKKKIAKGYLKWRLKRDMRKTDLLFCQTEVMRRRLERSLDCAGKTAICSNAITMPALQGDAGAETPLPKPLAALAGKMKLFCLARYYPHKNIEAIVDVFERHGDALPDVAAIITIEASQHPLAAKLLERVKRLGIEDRVVNVGPLGQEQLAGYYRHCDALLLPTFLESFTRAYIEAMHFGLPILTSDLDFAHGLCGDAALYFDPWDADSIHETIARLKSDSQLGEKMIEKGLALRRSSETTWEDIARTIVSHLERIALEHK